MVNEEKGVAISDSAYGPGFKVMSYCIGPVGPLVLLAIVKINDNSSSYTRVVQRYLQDTSVTSRDM